MVANAVLRQCERAGITVDVVPLDELDPQDASSYPGLLIALPTSLDDSWPQQCATITGLIEAYRARRRDGLDTLLHKRCSWHRAGVIQLIGPRAIVDHPALREAASRTCARQYLGRPVDVIRVYDPAAWTARTALTLAPPADPSTDGDARLRPLWQYLCSWHISAISSVPLLLDVIEQCRAFYENPAFPAMYRPVAGMELNRLSFILDGHPYSPTPQERTSWHENGARAWRRVEEQLRQVEPELARPAGRANTRGAQKDLHHLYLALRTLADYLHLLPPHEWESRFKNE